MNLTTDNYCQPQSESRGELSDQTFKPFLQALIKGDRLRCHSIVDEQRKSGVDFMFLYEYLFKKCLYEVGNLWEHNQISVATEHMATLIVEDIMAGFLPEVISMNRVERTVIVASVEKEEHQVGGKMVADVFEKHGWDALYLGANTDAHDLLRFVQERSPDLVALSLSVYTNVSCLITEINLLRAMANVPVIIGGQGLRHSGKKISQLTSTKYLKDLIELEKYIIGWCECEY